MKKINKKKVAIFKTSTYTLNIKSFDYQTILKIVAFIFFYPYTLIIKLIVKEALEMDDNMNLVNAQLVRVFNDILTIEETELKKSSFSDLSIKEMHTIEAIGMGENKTTGEVAKALSVTVGTLTVAVNNLVKKGYVDRVRSDVDRRIVRLKLTNRGRLFFRAHQHFHKKMVEAALEDMSGEEKEALVKGLQSLHRFLKKYY